MKKSVFTYESHGSNANYNLGIEVLLDINRKLTDNDNSNIRECVDKLVSAILKKKHLLILMFYAKVFIIV